LSFRSGAGELCHLANDPLKMDNLFGNPDYPALQKERSDMIRVGPDDVASTLPRAAWLKAQGAGGFH